MLPPFHGERVQGYGETMRDITDREIASWPVGASFPIRRAMQRITLDVILRTVFGVDDGPLFATLRQRIEDLLAVAREPDHPAAAAPPRPGSVEPLGPSRACAPRDP